MSRNDGYVYIFTSKRSGTLYAGVTRDLPCRLAIFTVYERAEGRTLSILIVLVTGIQQRRVCGAEEPFQPKDLVWLDSCDKHRNEEPGMMRKSVCGFPPAHDFRLFRPKIIVV
ncbi:hypothetical protein [Sinorhizobium meliloti]|uniref:hypothetical protein n=1 Tax=Rhizobium meliloti TaxID=382 RepID=UPI00398CF777